MTKENTQSINLDGIEYSLSNFSPEVINLVSLRNSWMAELTKAQLEAKKCECAIKTLDSELVYMVKAELAAKNPPSPPDTQEKS